MIMTNFSTIPQPLCGMINPGILCHHPATILQPPRGTAIPELLTIQHYLWNPN